MPSKRTQMLPPKAAKERAGTDESVSIEEVPIIAVAEPHPRGFISVGGYWKSQNLLGEGTFGEVFEGICKKTKTPVAVKVINKRKLHPTKINAEVRILQKLMVENCDYLIKFLGDSDTEGKSPVFYLVFEFCESNWAKYLKGLHLAGRVVKEVDMHKFLKQLSSGLEVLRRKNVIHHDLKPANILLAIRNGWAIIKIADFGEAHIQEAGYKAGYVGGTSQYMAPEVALGEDHDHVADLWSVGVILYESRFDVLPLNMNWENAFECWKALTAAELVIEAPFTDSPSLRSLINGLLMVNPKARMTFEEFQEHPFLMAEGGVAVGHAAEVEPGLSIDLMSEMPPSTVYGGAYDNEERVVEDGEEGSTEHESAETMVKELKKDDDHDNKEEVDKKKENADDNQKEDDADDQNEDSDADKEDDGDKKEEEANDQHEDSDADKKENDDGKKEDDSDDQNEDSDADKEDDDETEDQAAGPSRVMRPVSKKGKRRTAKKKTGSTLGPLQICQCCYGTGLPRERSFEACKPCYKFYRKIRNNYGNISCKCEKGKCGAQCLEDKRQQKRLYARCLQMFGVDHRTKESKANTTEHGAAGSSRAGGKAK